MRIVVIGQGNVGTVLASALVHAGITVEVVGRKAHPIVPLTSADGVFCCVPDAALPTVAARILEWPAAEPFHIVHCAGAYGPDVLGDVSPHHAVALHPFQTIGKGAVASVLRSIPWGLTCAAGANAWAERLVAVLEGTVVDVPNDDAARARYHALAVLSCNVVQAMLETVRSLGEADGYDVAALIGPIVRTTVDVAMAAMAGGQEVPMTGPVMRADAATIRRHLDSLPPVASDVYRLAQSAVATVVAERGATAPFTEIQLVLPLATVQTVVIYVMRRNGAERQVLTFTKPFGEGSGMQVPCGTIGLAETALAAAHRALEENSGITGATLQLVTTCTVDGRTMHVFAMDVRQAAKPVPMEEWTHWNHGNGAYAGQQVLYAWKSLSEAESLLQGYAGTWLRQAANEVWG
jgi:predicted short-subunit dehydrogenase-like oxidoreductase (DUF2520 family)/ADP-ribose pyrophosphatase YjhB (NUDIX family)